MSQQPNPTLIGAFVLGSIVLAVGVLAVFGGGRFFTERITYVAYFDESVSGLATGAPVTFRGVKVGEVGDIQVHVASDETVRIPVFLVLQQRRIRKSNDLSEDDDIIEQLIAQGMRAQLQLQSIVTGQLQIQLDFHPTLPLEARVVHDDGPEMPTTQSSLAELTERLEALSIEQVFADTQEVIAGLKKLVNSPDLEGALRGVNRGMQDVRELVSNAQQELDRVSRRFEGTLGEADATLVSVRETLSTARTALDTASESLAITADDSPLRYELEKALKEVTAAARSVRVLAEYLESNPDALVRGKRELK